MDTGSIFIDNCPLFRGDRWYLLAGEALPSRLELRCGLVRHAATGQEVPGSQIAGRVVAVGVSLPPPDIHLRIRFASRPAGLRGLSLCGRRAGLPGCRPAEFALPCVVFGRDGSFCGKGEKTARNPLKNA